jgi:hypothetical protein
MEKLERKNDGGGQPITPRSRSQEFPSLSRNGLVDVVLLDLLFQSPHKDAKIIGGMEEEESF